jgi:penicillin-binding protein 1A
MSPLAPLALLGREPDCRQPGSTYKPVYYSLALDRGYGYGSLLNDIPRAEVDPITGEVWIPQNLNNTVERG